MKAETINIRMPTGEAVDLAGGRIVEVGHSEASRQACAAREARLEPTERARHVPEVSTLTHCRRAVLYEVERNVWSDKFGSGVVRAEAGADSLHEVIVIKEAIKSVPRFFEWCGQLFD